MNNKDKEILTKATKILNNIFTPCNNKLTRMRKQQNIWMLEDRMNELSDVVEFVENVRDNKIKEFDGLCEENVGGKE